MCCSKPICSSLADQAKNDHIMKSNSNHGTKKKKKIGEFNLASDKKYMTKNAEI